MTGFIERPLRLRAPPRRRGAATLLLVMLLLLALGLAIEHAARTALAESRLIANDTRAHEALAAAQAGLESGLAALLQIDPLALMPGAEGGIRLDGPAGSLGNGATFATTIHDQGLPEDGQRRLIVEARGMASDGTGLRVLRQLARHAPWLAHPPITNITAGGTIIMQRPAQISNSVSPWHLWNGGDIIADPATGIETIALAPCTPAMACAGDPRLADLSGEDFFIHLFGRPSAVVAALARRLSCETCVLDAADPDGRPLWLDNAGQTVTIRGTLGTEDEPEIVIIDGDMRTGGDTTIHGLLYVQGDWIAGDGVLTVHGGIAVAGSIDDPGEVALALDPEIRARLAQRGLFVRVAGSWIDG